MLDEYKEIYEATANIIPNWRRMNKNQLCFDYIEHEHDSLKDAYLSAIICRYWGHINKYYELNKHSDVTEEDCYNWLIASILYALEKRRWLDKDSAIYNDPNGPDKVINRCMSCNRINFYQASNRDKRKLDHGMFAIESLQEANPEFDVVSTDAVSDKFDNEIYAQIISDFFYKKDYFAAFVLDCILYNNVFVDVEENEEIKAVFSKSKLALTLFNIDKKYLKAFSERFQIPLDYVEHAWKYFSKLTKTELQDRIDSALYMLKTDQAMLNLKGYLYVN